MTAPYPKAPPNRRLINTLTEGEEATIAGRLRAAPQGRLHLRDASGELKLLLTEPHGLLARDLVSATGHREGDAFAAREVALLVRHTAQLAPAQRRHVRARARMNAQLRAWFSDQDFIEVETPNLVTSPGTDVYLEAFSTRFSGMGQVRPRELYLHTSPEFAMKELLTEGHERIVQLCKVYRDGEWTRTHNPEFTMAEWYRAFADYKAVMADVEAVVRLVLGEAPIEVEGRQVRMDAPFEVLTVQEAFMRCCAGLDVLEANTAEALRGEAEARGLGPLAAGGGWDDLFHELLVTWVEPQLGAPTPTFLVDYPAPLAVLSRRRDDDPRVAERFELYIAGVELCNGFTELNDPVEQRARFAEERARRAEMGLPAYPMPERFLAALERGMPPSGGVALGLDRLLMLALGAESLSDVLIRALDA
ncbi:MAG: EF-P lysine aminoacylase GenX [Myxococcales bacterium]|nr:EF-P lysine aminoacylase GenX [Myxococcales bacterium]